jgi:hypothetical protein
MLSCHTNRPRYPVVLVYRTWAIWGRTRKSAIIYSTACAVTIVAVFVTTERGLQSVQCTANFLRDVCSSETTPPSKVIPRPLSRSLKCTISKGTATIAFVGYLLLTIVESRTSSQFLIHTNRTIESFIVILGFTVHIARRNCMYIICPSVSCVTIRTP